MAINPQEREDLVRIRYWGCNVLGHRHRNAQSAASCIVKRKGESGELKKLQRNLSMLKDLRSETPLVTISKIHHCSDSNITKAVNSTLEKARRLAESSGGCVYPSRGWSRSDFCDPALNTELNYLLNILQEREVVLVKLTTS